MQHQTADPVAESDGERHLDRRADQCDAPHGRELPQGEVESDREQEERHPDFCKQLYLVYVTDRRPEGVWTDEDAGGDVAEDQGQPKPPGHDTSQEGGHQDERYVTGDPQILALTLPSSKSATVWRRCDYRRFGCCGGHNWFLPQTTGTSTTSS